MEIQDIKEASLPGDTGLWLDDKVHGLTGVRFCVRPMTSSVAQREITRLVAACPPAAFGDDGTLVGETADAIDATVICEKCIVDWSGLTSKGKPVPYSPDVASTMITSDLFWKAIRACLTEAHRRAKEAEDKLSKNLPAPSKSKSKAAKST